MGNNNSLLSNILNNNISLFANILECGEYSKFEKIIKSLNNIDIVEPLYNNNILNLICSKSTRLICRDKVKCIELLINRKINMEYLGNRGYTPLHQILSKNTSLYGVHVVSAAKLLIFAGANIDAVSVCGKKPIDILNNNNNIQDTIKNEIRKLLVRKND